MVLFLIPITIASSRPITIRLGSFGLGLGSSRFPEIAILLRTVLQIIVLQCF